MNALPWPGWREIGFRFFFIYFLLFASPWTWLDSVPGVSFVTRYWYMLDTWIVQTCNRYALRIQPEVAPVFNGSGEWDTPSSSRKCKQILFRSSR